MISQTLAIIKPDAVENKFIGKIITLIEFHGFAISKMRMLRLKKEEAQKFYSIHRGKPFFDPLVDFMISGDIVAICLESENAVDKWREVIGATDPEMAKEGTIRKIFASSKQCNAVHGSDSHENAKIELDFFFN